MPTTERQRQIVEQFIEYNPGEITANNTPSSVLPITMYAREIVEALRAYAEETAGRIPRLEVIPGKHPLTYRYIQSDPHSVRERKEYGNTQSEEKETLELFLHEDDGENYTQYCVSVQDGYAVRFDFPSEEAARACFEALKHATEVFID